CLAVAPVLPVLDEEGWDAGEVAQVHAHLRSCAYCQAQHAIYVQLDGILVRHFAPSAEPLAPISVEKRPASWRDEESVIELNDSDNCRVTPLPRMAHNHRGRPLGLASLPAGLLLSLLAGALFATHEPLAPAKPLATPMVIPGSESWLSH